MNKEFLIRTPQEYKNVIEDIMVWFLESKNSNLILALSGDLGAGKTTFTQELAKHFFVAEPVTSPTFTIMKKYELKHPTLDELIHIDAYRIEEESEVLPLGLKSLFEEPNKLICIEWPEKIAEAIPNRALRLSFVIGEGEDRRVFVTYP